MYNPLPNVALRLLSKVNDAALLLVANVKALVLCKYLNCPALLAPLSPK